MGDPQQDTQNALARFLRRNGIFPKAVALFVAAIVVNFLAYLFWDLLMRLLGVENIVVQALLAAIVAGLSAAAAYSGGKVQRRKRA